MLLSVSSGDSALAYSAAYEYLVKSTVFCWLCVLSGKVGVTINHTRRSSSMAAAHVEPVFLKAGDLAAETDVLELCVAAERLSGRETIAGAQRIRGLWRVYPLTREARTSLLVSGVELHGQTVVCFDKNPYILRGGSEAPTTKLYISDIPISVDDGEIRNFLERLGCIVRSPMVSERARNKDGELTRFLTGRRFVFIEIPSSPVAAFSGGGPIQGHTLPQRKEIKRDKMRKMFGNRPYGLNLQLQYSLPFLL